MLHPLSKRRTENLVSAKTTVYPWCLPQTMYAGNYPSSISFSCVAENAHILLYKLAPQQQKREEAFHR